MADSLKFKIDNGEYEPPDLTTLDMNEAETLYNYTGFSLEDLFYDEDAEDAEEVQRRLRHPGIIKTLLHISYQRAHPDVKPARVTELIGKASYAEAVNVLAGITSEDDAGPPAPSLETNEQQQPSGESSNMNAGTSGHSSESSGNGSTRSSDERAVARPNTGTDGSVTSIPRTPAITLASYGQPT